MQTVSVWQRSPLQPLGHVHVYDEPLTVHLPPFRHGLVLHGVGEAVAVARVNGCAVDASLLPGGSAKKAEMPTTKTVATTRAAMARRTFPTAIFLVSAC